MGYHDELAAIKDLDEAIERQKDKRRAFRMKFWKMYQNGIDDSDLYKAIRIQERFNKRIEKLECKLFFVFGIG
jgi:hypothetical protein